MGASCYCCNSGHNQIPGTHPGDSLGACENCSILSCAAHGHRDGSYPRWICVVCDSSLLAGASLHHHDNGQVAQYLSIPIVRQGQRYETLSDFLRYRPKYVQQENWLQREAGDILTQAPVRFTTQITEPFWVGFEENGKQLMAAAIGLAMRIGLQAGDVIEPLGAFVLRWRELDE